MSEPIMIIQGVDKVKISKPRPKRLLSIFCVSDLSGRIIPNIVREIHRNSYMERLKIRRYKYTLFEMLGKLINKKL